MKQWIFVMIAVLLPGVLQAQDDDMYFVPTKAKVAKIKKEWGMPKDTYYSGSDRSVDEYNRMDKRVARSTVTAIDSAGNDIIEFSAVRGVYPPDTVSAVADNSGDYKYTKRMTRFEGYTPTEIYWEGYRDGRWDSPYYYGPYYSWYDPWYDPWYPGYYRPWGWYHPWGYRPWGWYGPRVYPGRAYVVRRTPVHRNHNSYRNSGYSRSISHGSHSSWSGGSTRGSFGGGGGSFGGGGHGGGGGRSLGGRR